MKNSEVYSKYYEDDYLPDDTKNNIVFRDDLDGVYLWQMSIDEIDRSLEYNADEEYVGGMYIQKAIADDLGIDTTAINTQEDFYDLLVKIKEGGYTDDNGNAVYPLGPKYWGGSVDALKYIATGYDWGVSDDYNLDENGDVKHIAETDHVYDEINFVRKLLDEDLMNPEFFTMDSTRAEEVSKNHNSAIIADVHNYEEIVYSSEDWIPLGPLNDISGDNKEVVRGKSGRVFGHLMGLLTTMKGIPLAYNKDMQEDKELVFDAIDTTKGCLALFTGMLKTMRFNNARMEESAKHGFTNATDAADYLVNHNVPFRDAHGIVGRLVLYCIEKNIALDDMSLEEFKAISPVFEEDIYEAISMKTCVDMRNTIGAPGKNAMEAVIRAERQYLKEQPAL